MYEIIVEDETVKKFEWNSIPSLLTSGQAIEAGSYTETNKEGKVISTSKISYLVKKIKQLERLKVVQEEVWLQVLLRMLERQHIFQEVC